jgi:hypothetical protein
VRLPIYCDSYLAHKSHAKEIPANDIVFVGSQK